MITNHNFYLNLAFNQAEKNLGKTKLNPSVGCIIVKNNSVNDIEVFLASLNSIDKSKFSELAYKKAKNEFSMETFITKTLKIYYNFE